MAKNVSIGLETVTEIPKRTFRKGSKYDAVLDEFTKSKGKVAKLKLPEGIEPSYLVTQLKKRKRDNIKITMVSGFVYLEKI